MEPTARAACLLRSLRLAGASSASMDMTSQSWAGRQVGAALLLQLGAPRALPAVLATCSARQASAAGGPAQGSCPVLTPALPCLPCCPCAVQATHCMSRRRRCWRQTTQMPTRILRQGWRACRAGAEARPLMGVTVSRGSPPTRDCCCARWPRAVLPCPLSPAAHAPDSPLGGQPQVCQVWRRRERGPAGLAAGPAGRGGGGGRARAGGLPPVLPPGHLPARLPTVELR